MFRFLGIQRVDFIPEGQKDPMQGYNVHFSDSTENENLVGNIPFKCWFTDEKAAELLHINRPADMGRFSKYVEKPCTMSFNRKGKIQGIQFDDEKKADYPPDTTNKPNKL